MPVVYEVGKSYSPNRTEWPEAGEYNYRANGHFLTLFYKGITPAEVTAITRRPCDFGALTIGPVLFFLYKFSGETMWSDAPYSWHMLKAARPDEATVPPPLEENERVLLNIILVEASTGIIKGMRQVSLSINLSRYLHAAIREQIEAPFNQKEFDQTQADTYRVYPQADNLAARAERCRIV